MRSSLLLPSTSIELGHPSTSSATPIVPRYQRRPNHTSGPAPTSFVSWKQSAKRSSSSIVNTIAPDRSYLAGALSATEQAELDAIKKSLTAQLSQMTVTHPQDLPSPSLQKANDCPCEDDEYHPSRGWRPQPHHMEQQQLWQTIRTEAREDADSEPALASFLYSTILGQPSLQKSMAFLLANKLANATMLGMQLMRLIQDAYEDDPSIIETCVADMQAVYDRDPACEKYTHCMLYFKGFQAVQCHHIAHWLWRKGRKPLALAIQSRVSEVFHVDVHPGAQLGRGVMMDHATGVVIGETAVIGDNVSMLHHVTLGGSGTGRGIRHPAIGHGVLLGAGVSVLGPVNVGAGSKIGAGSVVVTDLPCHCVAVGVPAKVIKRNLLKEPVKDMDQCMDFILDYVI